MKKLILALSLTFGLGIFAHAQTPGKYNIASSTGVSLNGGTNNVAVASTNTTSAFDVSEYHNWGVQLSFKGTGAGTSTVQLLGFQSIDSTTYETTPSFSRLIALNGTTLVCTNIDFTTYGAATYKFQIGNTNETVAVTNITFLRRFKSPMVLTR